MVGFSVAFIYKGRHFSLSLKEAGSPIFCLLEVRKGEMPDPSNMLSGMLKHSKIATAKIHWDGAFPKDPLVAEAMDVITGYLVERNFISLSEDSH